MRRNVELMHVGLFMGVMIMTGFLASAAQALTAISPPNGTTVTFTRNDAINLEWNWTSGIDDLGTDRVLVYAKLPGPGVAPVLDTGIEPGETMDPAKVPFFLEEALLEEPPGMFYWQVVGNNVDGQPAASTSIQQFTVATERLTGVETHVETEGKVTTLTMYPSPEGAYLVSQSDIRATHAGHNIGALHRNPAAYTVTIKCTDAGLGQYSYIAIDSYGDRLTGHRSFNVGACPRAIRTVAQFDRLSTRARESFAVPYMSTHPDDVCFSGRVTPLADAKNIAVAMAQIVPGPDTGGGPPIRSNESIGKAIRQVEANIGC
jgi:hypothetical protein